MRNIPQTALTMSDMAVLVPASANLEALCERPGNGLLSFFSVGPVRLILKHCRRLRSASGQDCDCASAGDTCVPTTANPRLRVDPALASPCCAAITSESVSVSFESGAVRVKYH